MKKQLSLVVALVTLLTTLFAAMPANAAFSDVPDDYKYKDAITTLSTLNVINGYENGTFEPEKSITRAEFTKIIVYMLGSDNMTEKITQFEDVSEDHWANANIKTAYDLGIINGFDEKTFKPDDPVTYEQALKMVVCALGYETLAEQNGGYPQGYQAEAAALELTNDITDTAYEANASRGVVSQIMYNALEVPMLDPLTLSTAEGKNLLNDYLNTYILTGTVVGVEDSTTADCTRVLGPGQMDILDNKGDEYVIDFTEYTENSEDLNKYLGNTIIVYYRQDRNSEDKWLIAIDNETYTNTEVTVNSRDIDSYENGTLRYYTGEESKASTLRFDTSEMTIRYNGRAVSGDVELDGSYYSPADALGEWLDPNSDNFIYGTVRCINNSSGGRFNVIDIYDYDTIVAYRAPNSTDYKITDKTITGNSLTLDPDSAEYEFTLTKNGSSINVTSIATNDVINYAVSLDGEFYTAVATNESVNGSITALSIEEDGESTISIDNTEYPVSERFLSYIENKEQKELRTGMEITAYMDMFGTLEWGTVTSSSTFYPYAYAINYSSEGETYYLRLFAPSNTKTTSFTSSTAYRVKSYQIADKVKLNNRSSSPYEVISTLEETAAAANPDADIPNIKVELTGINQLIKVGFNDEAQITQVITIDTEAEGTQNDDNGTLVRYRMMDPENKYYVSSSSVKESSTGSTYYSIRTSTPMFVIPKDRTDYDSYALKSAVTTNSMTSGGTYYLDAYDVDTTRYPSCVLVYNTNFKSGTSITRTTTYRLVADDITEEYDEEEDDIFDMLYTYNSATSLSTTPISDEADFSGIEKGDVILYGTDSENFADSYMLVQDYDEIRRVLDGDAITYTDENGEERTETYAWTETQEQTEENNWQLYKFDWRYPKTGVSEPTDEYYQTGGNVTDIFSRAAMFNILQVLPDTNAIYATKSGFDENGNIDDSTYEEIKISSSTKFIRYDSETEEFTPYAEGTEDTTLTLTDLKEALYYGEDCSKVLVTYISSTTSASSTTPTARFIVIYE